MNDDEKIFEAAQLIRGGGVVAFPTETVYGLGADAFAPLAVARIFEVKGRPRFDPLIVHIADPKDLDNLVADIPDGAKALIDRFWPGPITFVLPKTSAVPDIVTAGLPTIAVRMPNHAMALRLIELSGSPLAAPSANPFGYLSPTTADHVRDQLGDRVDFILDGGPCFLGLESTILSFVEEPPRLLRPGGVPLEEIESVVGKVDLVSPEGGSPSAPGMLPKHYAPRTPITLVPRETIESYQIEEKRVGFLLFREPQKDRGSSHVEVLSPKGDLREAAANLFSSLRRLDDLDLEVIVAETIPEAGLGRAIMDRLRRASRRDGQVDYVQNGT